MDEKDEIEIEAKTDAELEAAAEAEPFDESQLLELAKSEGLLEIEAAGIDETPVDEAKPLDLPEEEQAAVMASIETILFMSDKPVSLPKLRSTINNQIPLVAYRTLLSRLRDEFAKDYRGVEIAELSLGFQLRTKPQMATVLRKMVKTQPLRLTGATMEVLAIVAYKQPVPKDELDKIRGVDCGYVLRNLMEKRLIKIAGRSDLPGKPMVYGTTHEFLELFNLKDNNALPPLHEVEAMVAASEVGFEEKTQAVMDEFGKMVANSENVLFDDSQVDTELEALRTEIASIPTSTPFIDEQKAKEKLQLRLTELANQGLMLDEFGNTVPLGSVTAPDLDTLLAVTHGRIRHTHSVTPLEELLSAAPLEVASETIATTEAIAAPEAVATIEPLVTTETIVADTEELAIQTVSTPLEITGHEPSAKLEAEAQAAGMQRHAEMIAQALSEAALVAEVAVVNAEALADAVVEAKIEQKAAKSDELPAEDLDLEP